MKVDNYDDSWISENICIQCTERLNTLEDKCGSCLTFIAMKADLEGKD